MEMPPILALIVIACRKNNGQKTKVEKNRDISIVVKYI